MYFYSTGQNYVPNMKPPLGAVPNPYSPFSYNIVGDWPFWENGGTTVFDLSGNGSMGTLSGDAAWSRGQFGAAIEFFTKAGVGSINYGSHSLLISDDTDKTINFFINMNTPSAAYNVPVTNGPAIIGTNPQSEGWGFYSGYQNATQMYFAMKDSDGDKAETMVTGLTINQWYMVTGVIDKAAATVHIYIDGVHKNSNTNALVGSYTGTTLKTAPGGSYSFMDGILDNLCIWNRILTASEIAQIYREPFIRYRWTLPQLIHYYTVPPTAGIMTLNTGYWGAI